MTRAPGTGKEAPSGRKSTQRVGWGVSSPRRERMGRILSACAALGMAARCAHSARPEGGEASPGASVTPVAATGPSPCSGLVQDRAPHPMTALSPPSLGRSTVDPEFRTVIKRITAVAVSEGENAVITPVYSTVQAWNADEWELILGHRGQGHELYHGRTYAFIRRLALVSPTDIEHVLWDPVDPDVLYYPSNYNAVPNLMRYRVSTDTSELVRRFESCPVDWGKLLSLGSDPAYLSWGPESRVVGLQCGEQKFLYDVAKNAILASATIATANAPLPGPSGLFAYLDGRVYDARLRVARTLDLANPGEHSSLGRSTRVGHDFYAS